MSSCSSGPYSRVRRDVRFGKGQVAEEERRDGRRDSLARGERSHIGFVGVQRRRF